MDIRARFGANLPSNHIDERTDIMPDARLFLVDLFCCYEVYCRFHLISDSRITDPIVCQGAYQRRLHLRLIRDVTCLRDVWQQPFHKIGIATVVSKIQWTDGFVKFHKISSPLEWENTTPSSLFLFPIIHAIEGNVKRFVFCSGGLQPYDQQRTN